jgi:hypothetical protein
MAYNEPTYRRHAADDANGSEPTAYRTGAFSAPDYRGRRRGDSTSDLTAGDAETAAPRHEGRAADDTGRDRIGVHLGWEAVLLAATLALAFLLFRVDGTALRPPALDTLLVTAAAIGLLTLGAGISLRAGVPNLAVGPIAVAAGLQYAENGDRGLVSAGGQALAVAVVGAVVIALLVVAFHVPGWAATLAAAFAVVTFNELRAAPVNVQGVFDPLPHAYLLYAGFAALAVLGGLLGTVPAVRNSLGRMRPVGDPAHRRGTAAALPVLGALVVSSVLAVVAGTLMAAATDGPVIPVTGLEWSGIALGVAMVAGTSAYGRRGGIFGTLIAATALALFLDYSERRDLDIALFAIAAATIVAGLAVSRLIEAYGKPRGGDAVNWAGNNATNSTWSPDLPETWSPATTTQSTTAPRWDDERWSSR